MLTASFYRIPCSLIYSNLNFIFFCVLRDYWRPASDLHVLEQILKRKIDLLVEYSFFTLPCVFFIKMLTYNLCFWLHRLYLLNIAEGYLYMQFASVDSHNTWHEWYWKVRCIHNTRTHMYFTFPILCITKHWFTSFLNIILECSSLNSLLLEQFVTFFTECFQSEHFSANSCQVFLSIFRNFCVVFCTILETSFSFCFSVSCWP